MSVESASISVICIIIYPNYIFIKIARMSQSYRCQHICTDICIIILFLKTIIRPGELA